MNRQYKPRKQTATRSRKTKQSMSHYENMQYGGVLNLEDLQRYEQIPAEEKHEVLQYVMQLIDPEDLVDHVIAWIDKNPGLRFDRFTMRELLDEYNPELVQVIADRIHERLLE